MNRLILPLFILCTGLTPSLIAQVLEPITEVPLGKDANQIVINTLTGIPVLQTKSEYVGLDPEDGSVMWVANRNSRYPQPDLIYGNGPVRDFEEVPGTYYVFASGDLIDVTNGNTIIDGAKHDLCVLRTYHTVSEANMVLLEIGGRGAIYLYALNLLEGDLAWDVQLRKVPVLPRGFAREVPGTVLGPYIAPHLNPYFDVADNLIYPSHKHLALINTKSGELKWNVKISPAYIVANEEGTRMVIAEEHFDNRRMPSSSNDDTFNVGGRNDGDGGWDETEGSFRKRLHLINTETGQSIWKKKGKMSGNVLYVEPFEDDFLVVHDKGMNIYSFDDPKPEGRWKKDYVKEGVLSVEVSPAGLTVYSRNERMLIDLISGKEKWEEAEETDTEPQGFMRGVVSARKPQTKKISNFDVTLYEDYFVVGNELVSSTYHYDMIIVEEDRIAVIDYVFDDDNILMDIVMSVTQLDGDELERKVESVRLRHGIHGFDKVDGGYFVYNDRGFCLYRYDRDKGFEEVRKEYYPDPTAAKRFIIGAAVILGSAYASNELPGFRFALRQVNGRVDEDFAFFFTRDGKEGPTLFKVDKDTGDEVAKFRFDDPTPLYEIDYQSGRLYYQAKEKFKVFELK